MELSKDPGKFQNPPHPLETTEIFFQKGATDFVSEIYQNASQNQISWEKEGMAPQKPKKLSIFPFCRTFTRYFLTSFALGLFLYFLAVACFYSSTHFL